MVYGEREREIVNGINCKIWVYCTHRHLFFIRYKCVSQNQMKNSLQYIHILYTYMSISILVKYSFILKYKKPITDSDVLHVKIKREKKINQCFGNLSFFLYLKNSIKLSLEIVLLEFGQFFIFFYINNLQINVI